MAEDRHGWRLCLVCLMAQGGSKKDAFIKQKLILRQSLFKVVLCFESCPGHHCCYDMYFMKLNSFNKIVTLY